MRSFESCGAYIEEQSQTRGIHWLWGEVSGYRHCFALSDCLTVVELFFKPALQIQAEGTCRSNYNLHFKNYRYMII